MRRLSTGDVTELSGIPANTLSEWVAAGLLKPVEGGDGKGRHRRWSVAQAVALTFAAEWRRWGAGPAVLRPLITNLARMTDEQMLAEFDAGRTHLVQLPDGTFIEPVGRFIDMDRYDMSRVYREVTERIRRMEHRKGNTTGRNRGLVAK